METTLSRVSSNKVFNGELIKYKFKSTILGGLEAHFNVFLPITPNTGKVPVLIYLAGLTCTEDTGPQKGGFFRDAAELGLAIVFPDTSPRGAGIPGEDDDWDFGTGAGFYLDATNPKYSKHYNMYSHITSEIPSVTEHANLPLDWSRKSVFGHSMGGHGALVLYLKSLATDQPFRSVSAFAPISNPAKAPWGEKAFSGYLSGGIKEGEANYDATELLLATKSALNIRIDYGTDDQFYIQGQLLPENFLHAAETKEHNGIVVNAQKGYDHSYYFISTFSAEHMHFHARFLLV